MKLTEKFAWFGTRFFLIALFAPIAQNALFTPFLANASNNFIDPWGSWLNSGGRTDAFPYGPLMYGILVIASLFGNVVYSVNTIFSLSDVTSLALSFILLTFEYFSSKAILTKQSDNKVFRICIILAPLPIYTSYIYGQNDIIPSVLILVTCYLISNGQWRKAGALAGLGVCVKFSLILVLPLVIIYFIIVKQLENSFKFLSLFVPTALAALLPILWSDGYYEMAIRSPEFVKSLDVAIPVGTLSIYLLPLGYLVILLALWSLPRATPQILIAYIALSFFAISTLQARSIGWYLWGYLTLLLFMLKVRMRLLTLFYIWQCTLVLFYLYNTELLDFRYFQDYQWYTNNMVLSLIFTINVVVSFILIFKLFLELRTLLDPFGLATKPISIAIAGDSGVGKDTLVHAISQLISEKEVSVLLGDDYHLGDRTNLIWKNRTHLNVSANDLSRWNRDTRLILSRKRAHAQHYDHSNGRFTGSREIKASDFLVLNGLHSLLLSEVARFDLRIFLSMEESLRVKLKSKRDTTQRGVLGKGLVKERVALRKPDSEKFIAGQENLADLIIEIAMKPAVKGKVIEYLIRSKDEALLYEIYRLFHAYEPDIAKVKVETNGVSVLLLRADKFTSEIYEKTLKNLVPELDNFIQTPNFNIHQSSILAVVVIAHCARKREYADDY